MGFHEFVFCTLHRSALGVPSCCDISSGAFAARGAVLAHVIDNVLVRLARHPAASPTAYAVEAHHRHRGVARGFYGRCEAAGSRLLRGSTWVVVGRQFAVVVAAASRDRDRSDACCAGVNGDIEGGGSGAIDSGATLADHLEGVAACAADCFDGHQGGVIVAHRDGFI